MHQAPLPRSLVLRFPPASAGLPFVRRLWQVGSVPDLPGMVHTGTVSSRRAAMCISLLVSLVLLGAASSAIACVPASSVSLQPQSGPSGSTTTVKGESFPKGDVEIRWDSLNGQVLGMAQGPSFSLPVTIPNVEPGVYRVLATAMWDDRERALGRASFTVNTTTTTAESTSPQPEQPEQSGSGSGGQQQAPSASEGQSTGPSAPSATPPSDQNNQISTSAPAPPPPFPALAARAPEIPKPPARATAIDAGESAALPAPPDSEESTAVATGRDQNRGDISSALPLPPLENAPSLPTQPVRSQTTPWQWGFIPLTVLVIAVWLDVRRRDRRRMGLH